MENEEDDFEVYPAHTPQSAYLRSIGYSSSDFISVPVKCECESPGAAVESKSFIVVVRKLFTNLYCALKGVIIPTADYSEETELIKHCGLLFKENAVLVEEFSPLSSKKNRGNCSCLRLLLHFKFSIVFPLAIVVFKPEKPAIVPVFVFLSLASIYFFNRFYEVYAQLNRRNSLVDFVSSLKQYNQKFLKALQFISENDKSMMKHYSRLTKMEISGYNSYRVVDSSWLHFKTLVVESTVSLMKDFHSLCRVMKESFMLNEHHNYLSICSVDFCELGIFEIGTENCQAYLTFLNKLKLILFLLESELLSFIAVNLSESHRNPSVKISHIFSAIRNISKVLVISSNNIEHSFNQFYRSGKQEQLLEKSKIVGTVDSDILRVFLETRALAHSTLSAAIQMRNLEKYLEKKIEAPQSMDKIETWTYTDEMLLNIESELFSSESKLKTLVRHLMLLKKPASDPTDIDFDDEEKSVHDQGLQDIVQTGIEVGQSDFNPTQPDEVFVGVSVDDVDKVDTGNDNDFPEEYFIAQAHNRSSKNLIKELKVKLKDKKNEMVEREKAALQRQNVPDLEEENNMSFESSDEEDCHPTQLEISDSEGATFREKMSHCGRSYTYNKDNCISENIKHSDSVVDNLTETVSVFESSPLVNISSCSTEKLESVIKNPETSVSARASTLPADTLIDSKKSICNPLAISVANISRIWNQDLRRTEECFGSDGECSSDCDN